MLEKREAAAQASLQALRAELAQTQQALEVSAYGHCPSRTQSLTQCSSQALERSHTTSLEQLETKHRSELSEAREAITAEVGGAQGEELENFKKSAEAAQETLRAEVEKARQALQVRRSCSPHFAVTNKLGGLSDMTTQSAETSHADALAEAKVKHEQELIEARDATRATSNTAHAEELKAIRLEGEGESQRLKKELDDARAALQVSPGCNAEREASPRSSCYFHDRLPRNRMYLLSLQRNRRMQKHCLMLKNLLEQHWLHHTLRSSRHCARKLNEVSSSYRHPIEPS